MNSDLTTKIKIKGLLAEHLGLNIDDIKDDDTLVEDLHMVPSDLSDFLKTLDENGFDSSSLNLIEIETFEDLAEALSDKVPLD